MTPAIVLAAALGAFPPGTFPNRQAVLADVWAHVQRDAGASAGLEAPYLYFSKFDPEAQDPEWTLWQKRWVAGHPAIYEDWLCRGGDSAGDARWAEGRRLCGRRAELLAWVGAHPELQQQYPFPKSFRAFHYDGTNRIQIDPGSTFFAFYQNGPDGMPRDFVGLGYYVTGHELTHYALESRGVPGERHHCLFVTADAAGGSPMERLADFLIARGYASYAVKRYGLGPEIALDPCAAGSAPSASRSAGR